MLLELFPLVSSNEDWLKLFHKVKLGGTSFSLMSIPISRALHAPLTPHLNQFLACSTCKNKYSHVL